MADLIGEMPVAQDTQGVPFRGSLEGANLKPPLTPPRLGPRLLAHTDEKSSSPEDQSFPARRSSIDDWQAPKFQSSEIDHQQSSGTPTLSEGEEARVGELCEDIYMLPGSSP